MSIVEQMLMDKYCFVQCPRERCNCRRGNPEKWALQQARLGIKVEPENALIAAAPKELSQAD
jgi:hypothetical protein